MPPAETAPVPLSITAFGPLQARVHGVPLPALRSRKPLSLLALLCLRANRPVQRAWLAATLWPDSDQDRAFANLRPALSELRGALGTERKRLQSPDRHTLLLDLSGGGAEVDVLAFDTAIASGAASDLARAVALYRGPLLEGSQEEWVPPEREAREQAYLQALERLGDASLSGGDYTAAAGYYQRAVRTDPWREAARRGWIEALEKNGDANAALQVYREFVVFLSHHPNAVPDAPTSALYQRLRTEVRQRAGGANAAVAAGADAAPVPRVQGYLPHPLTELVGREDARRDVARQLRQSRLVTLTGPGGIGKTRLALAVAGEVVGEYPDGAWLVALESLSEDRLVVPQIASVFVLREEPGRTPLQSVTDHLRRKRLLLVLDNCEHLLEKSAEVVAHLLRECPGVCILATSREPLGVAGEEAVWGVPALAVPDADEEKEGQAAPPQALMDCASVRLFVERAQAVQKGFALSVSNARAVARACRRLEGIPLAIELAAARARVMTVAQIVARLDEHLVGLLTTGSRTAQSRQQTLRGALDWSYALLTEAERSLLRRLSVFAGGCSLEAAEAVCSGEGFEAGRVPDLLASLTDKSLVRFEERGPSEGGRRRYRLLEMVRQYAAEALEASGEAERIKARHRDWFLALAEEAEPQLHGAEQTTGLERLEAEHHNLRVALAFCETDAQGTQAGLRLGGALFLFWNLRGDFTEGRAYLKRILERDGAAQAATVARAKALKVAGALAYRQGDYVSARALNEEGLALCRKLEIKSDVADFLMGLGNVAHDQGDFGAARALNAERLALANELGDRREIAWSTFALGRIVLQQGDDEAGRALLEEGLAIFRALGDRGGIAVCLKDLGVMAFHHGDFRMARSLIEQSLAIYREAADKSGITWSLHDLGYVALGEGDATDTAYALFEESLTLARELGDKYNIAKALQGLGRAALDQGDYDAARELLQDSLTNLREAGIKERIDVSLDAFASLAHRERQGLRAARLWGAATRLRERLRSPRRPVDQETYDRETAQARAALDEDAFSAAFEEGRAMTQDQAVAFSLEAPSDGA